MLLYSARSEHTGLILGSRFLRVRLIKHHISKNEDAVSIPRLMVKFSQFFDTVHSLEV
jgi:hypothetical protein